MLLQIREPNSSKPTIVPNRKMAVGIDLGTTNTLVAIMVDGKPQCLADTNGTVKIPSIVHFDKEGPVCIGEAAQAKLLSHPQDTIVSIKRFMGRTLDEIPLTHTYPYDFVDQGKLLGIRTVQGIKNPIEISALILAEARRRVMAEYADCFNMNENDLLPAVITVPAYFDDAQRQATKDAAQLANIQVLRLLNEPTAAAVAYGVDIHNTPTEYPDPLYVVYDLGGGTFDVSILSLSRGVFQVRATHGNTALGGDDFDRAIYHWLYDELSLSTADEYHLQDLLVQIRNAREQLTDIPKTTLTLRSNQQTLTKELHRETLCTLTKPLVDQTLTSMRRTLKDAKLGITDFAGVILVGGATRMPHVRNAIENFFHQSALTGVDPERIVAEGAARQADILIGNQQHEDTEHLLLDVLPLSLGIETYGGLVERIITRNATIPVARAQEFTTQRDGQQAMTIHVVQGEREMVNHCRSLARFELHGLPGIAAGLPRIRVTFQVDADGLLTVTATEETTQTTAQVEVKPSYGLTEDAITTMLRESMQRAKEDLEHRQLVEQRVIAEETTAALKKALQENGDLLDPQISNQLKNEMEKLHHLQQGHDVERIRQAISTLNHYSEPFAQMRMNKHIAHALKGKSIDPS